MIAYPSTLPCVSRAEGLSATAFSGAVRTPMEAGNVRQRRAHRALPHQLSLAWMIPQRTTLAAFLAWCNANAWGDWFTLTLPGLIASRLGLRTAEVPVRFVSDVRMELVTGRGLWYWRVGVDAEYLPSAADLGPMPMDDGWIVAGTPSAPALLWIVAGTPGQPSPWAPLFGL